MPYRRMVRAGVVASMLAAFLTIVSNQPVNADEASKSAECTVRWLSTGCQSGSIPANPYSHSINVDIETGICATEWRVYDTANDHIVGQGGLSRHSGYETTIRGLYGNYKVAVTGCHGTRGWIGNGPPWF